MSTPAAPSAPTLPQSANCCWCEWIWQSDFDCDLGTWGTPYVFSSMQTDTDTTTPWFVIQSGVNNCVAGAIATNTGPCGAPVDPGPVTASDPGNCCGFVPGWYCTAQQLGALILDGTVTTPCVFSDVGTDDPPAWDWGCIYIADEATYDNYLLAYTNPQAWMLAEHPGCGPGDFWVEPKLWRFSYAGPNEIDCTSICAPPS